MKSTNLEFQKKTFNIEIDNIRDMQEFIPSRKQTEFVNKIIREKFNEIKQQQSKQQAINALEQMWQLRKPSDKTAIESIRVARHSRVDQ